MPTEKTPVAVKSSEVPVRAKRSFYPEPFASRMQGRSKRQLGELFKLANFGVNLRTWLPGRHPRFGMRIPSRTNSCTS